jgi:nucleotide-binding universal stress UspA family protein
MEPSKRQNSYLVPIDPESKFTRHLDWLCLHLLRENDSVYLLSIVRPFEENDPLDESGSQDMVRSQMNSLVQEWHRRLDFNFQSHCLVIASGNVASEIMSQADQINPTLVVMGCRKRRLASGLVLNFGSVSKRVSESCQHPVTVISE